MGSNELAFEVFEEMIDLAEDLHVDVSELDNGTIVVDAGVKARGGLWAGIFLSRLCMADLADIQIIPMDLKGTSLPGVQVVTDYPVISCMASQCAMWQLKVDNFFAMCSGPARILARKTKELYEKIGFEEQSDVAVLVLESNELPDAAVASHVAEKCGIDPADLRLAVAPTNSVAGLVQVSARVVETGLHKLFTMGFEINTILNGWGRAPISPIVGDATMCMGSSNDAIIYGGETYYTLEYPNIEELKAYLGEMPSEVSRDYGLPFYKTFKAAGFDFFKVDHNVFAPAKIVMNDLESKQTFVAGRVNPEVLADSFNLRNIGSIKT